MFYIIDYHNLCCGEGSKICYLKIFIYQLGLASEMFYSIHVP